MSYKRILVAVDGSHTATLAVKEAIKLAKSHRSRLRLIYIADEFVLVGEGVPFDFKKYEHDIRQYGKKVLARAKSVAEKAGVSAEVVLIENSEYSRRISDLILQAASSWRADLLVIGTHGRRGFSRLVLGSVAEGVIRMSAIPVLLIRGKK